MFAQWWTLQTEFVFLVNKKMYTQLLDATTNKRVVNGIRLARMLGLARTTTDRLSFRWLCMQVGLCNARRYLEENGENVLM